MSYINILVGSYHGSAFLKTCVDSLKPLNVTVAIRDTGYEMGKIRWAYENTTWDEFLFLHDSIEVKRHDWIFQLFEEFRGRSVMMNADPSPGGSFMVKYRREV